MLAIALALLISPISQAEPETDFHRWQRENQERLDAALDDWKQEQRRKHPRKIRRQRSTDLYEWFWLEEHVA